MMSFRLQYMRIELQILLTICGHSRAIHESSHRFACLARYTVYTIVCQLAKLAKHAGYTVRCMYTSMGFEYCCTSYLVAADFVKEKFAESA